MLQKTFRWLSIGFFTLHSFSIHAQTNTQDAYFDISKNMEIFTALCKELNTYYVDPIEPGKMMKKGIDEMLKDLDPYTTYISEEDIEDYRFQTTGKYGGIGASLRKKGDYLVINEPFENSPTIKAGIKAGDIVLEIDGKSTKGKEIDDVSKFLKGSPNTSLTLKIKDPVTGTESNKKITREEIQVSSVPYAGFIGPAREYAYVRLSQFTDHCSSLLKNALDSLKKVNPQTKGIILDLRYNPGGLLEEAVNISNLFIPSNQLVVTTKGKNEEWDKTYKTSLPAWDDKTPLAVLINRNSASASEIVSGTIQDLDRGVIIGQKSFGKGLVQTTRNLPFNSKLKVTTAKYYTPSGRCIQALDYTHRNEDGSVGKIPDSLQSIFNTKNGRKVKDGGGIDPDITTPMRESNKIAETLLYKHYIFDYATQYAATHPTINKPDNFSLTDAEYNSFIQWLSGKDIDYKTKTEETLLQLKEMAEKENYFTAVKADFDRLQQAINIDKKADLLKHKKTIARLLTDEIITRYYFQKGRIQSQLTDDEEIAAAINVLADPTRYQQILKSVK